MSPARMCQSDDQDQRRSLDDHADHLKVVDRVIRHRNEIQILRVGDRIGEQRVPIGRGPRRIGTPQSARTTRLVLDDDALANAILQHCGKNARWDICQSARRKRHDHGDRVIGIVLRRRFGRQEPADHEGGEQRQIGRAHV